MEQVLDVYMRPADPTHPVVCMDELPIQLLVLVLSWHLTACLWQPEVDIDQVELDQWDRETKQERRST